VIQASEYWISCLSGSRFGVWLPNRRGADLGGWISAVSSLVRRGYLRVGAYVGAGLILSGIGEAILAAGHLVIGLLQGAGLWFAVLFIALCGPTTGCVAWLVMREYLTELAAKTAALDAPRKKLLPRGARTRIAPATRKPGRHGCRSHKCGGRLAAASDSLRQRLDPDYRGREFRS